MRLKKIVVKIHLWLGLMSGLIVFIVAITGCIYAFQEEIQNSTQPFRFVNKQSKDFILPSKAIRIATQALPNREVHAVMYSGEKKAAKVIFYKNEDYYYFVYINPYTGEVLKVSNEYKTFFRFILDGHYYLWLPPTIGQPIVATATLTFLVMIITGIILWWPKNRNGTKQRLKIKWNARWRRVNFDLHSVIGFYVSWVAIVFAITGLVWGFQWVGASYYFIVTGGDLPLPYEEPKSSQLLLNQKKLPAIDQLWLGMKDTIPSTTSIEIHTPTEENSSIEVSINPDPNTYWKTDYRYYDQYSLEELSVKHIWGKFSEATTSKKVIRMNYDIHVGSILGFPGKVLAFLSSLIIATLPITGILLWWGRKNKKQKKDGN